VFNSFLNRTVTVFLDGAPTVTAMVVDVDKCSATLLATSGSTIFIPFTEVTAVLEYPTVFPPAPTPA
ncbi:MAG: hypothetical protein AAGU23_01755, partial [Bacillota bacterium]